MAENPMIDIEERDGTVTPAGMRYLNLSYLYRRVNGNEAFSAVVNEEIWRVSREPCLRRSLNVFGLVEIPYKVNEYKRLEKRIKRGKI